MIVIVGDGEMVGVSVGDGVNVGIEVGVSIVGIADPAGPLHEHRININNTTTNLFTRRTVIIYSLLFILLTSVKYNFSTTKNRCS